MSDPGNPEAPSGGVIAGLIAWSLNNRFLVIAATLIVIALGVRAVQETPVDAIPDLSENQVIVFTDWPGRSPQEVEDQITYPLSTNLQGLAGVREVRASSMFGFSMLTVVFEDDVDNYFARTRILERLSFLQDLLPEGVTPQLGPDATGLGWVYQYYFEVDPAEAPGGGYSLGDLRSLQDFYVRYQLSAVSGVAEVASIGGFVKAYEVAVSPQRMRQHGITLAEVMQAVEEGNQNVGGKTIEENGMEFIIRGVGLIESLDDLRRIAVRIEGEVPIYLGDVAEVRIGSDFRRGALDVDGREVVGGIVVMRTGANAMKVIEGVKERLRGIAPSLPPGVSVRAFYDRSDLIERTIDTLRKALIEEVVLVTLAHILFLWHFRSILIVTVPLPVSILIAFLLMNTFGITSNIMSLAGIAIAIGVLVDAGIVMTENVIRHCERAERRKGARLTRPETWEQTLAAAQQVGRPIFFAMAIIILAFLPVFALTGQEGKLFHPLAFTKTFAMVGATLLGVTLVPVLCSWLVRGPFHPERSNRIMGPLIRIYEPVLDAALRHGRTVVLLAGALLLLCLGIAFGLPRPLLERLDSAGLRPVAELFTGFGKEFMPPLEEGSLLFMPVLLPSTSLTEVKRIMAWQDRVMTQVPEVASAAGKLGRAETATDPAPVEMIETTIQLRPRAEWRPGMTKDKLVAELSERLSAVPGYVPGFLQPIENRILMLSTGIRAQVGVKLLGSDLDELQRLAFEVEKVVRSVPGAVGVAPSRVQGKPYLEVIPDRMALARYGISFQDVMDVVEAGLGGRTVSTTIEGRERFPIRVRLPRSERDDISRLGEILIAVDAERSVPLGQVAEIRRSNGPNMIESEDGLLRVFVQSNVQGRDLGGFVEELKEAIADRVKLPKGVTVEFSGAYENQLRAAATLQWVLPVVLVIIFMLLTVVFRSPIEAAHVILAVPFALTGGVLLQAALGYPFSVAVWVGYIALFGTAIQTGVIMVVYLDEAVARKRREQGDRFSDADLIAAVKEGAMLRLRPKVMTVATVIASLLPIMWSTSTGADVMKPLATPVIGGMLSSLLHILVVTPVLFLWLRRRELGLVRRKPGS